MAKKKLTLKQKLVAARKLLRETQADYVRSNFNWAKEKVTLMNEIKALKIKKPVEGCGPSVCADCTCGKKFL